VIGWEDHLRNSLHVYCVKWNAKPRCLSVYAYLGYLSIYLHLVTTVGVKGRNDDDFHFPSFTMFYDTHWLNFLARNAFV